MLTKVKLALQLSGNIFDTELNDLIQSAVIDLNLAGVNESDVVTTATTNPIVTRAIVAYCVFHFELEHGSLEKAEKLKKAYDEIKAMLGMASGYTVWSQNNGSNNN